MLQSIESLISKVSLPLGSIFGPGTKVLTVEAHGHEIRGFARTPGKIVRYVLDAQSHHLRTFDHLTLAKLQPFK